MKLRIGEQYLLSLYKWGYHSNHHLPKNASFFFSQNIFLVAIITRKHLPFKQNSEIKSIIC